VNGGVADSDIGGLEEGAERAQESLLIALGELLDLLQASGEASVSRSRPGLDRVEPQEFRSTTRAGTWWR